MSLSKCKSYFFSFFLNSYNWNNHEEKINVTDEIHATLYNFVDITASWKWTAYWNLKCQNFHTSVCVYTIVFHNNRCSDGDGIGQYCNTILFLTAINSLFNIKHQVSKSNVFGQRRSEKKREEEK